ncbi:hypothetical protein [Pseudogemmobacter faecipullorum]|uniref:Uncharacterized protein n=1 Tax=Pseudogemmobacter faecipullorum TaxID=2755041 RepID=A0ABS8CJL5_9RHOB|nr:hypothetical protein [Pseudogemmobacter faecipullorum]MCB5409597.1 hypothetical protein [Pseudogemmobacter faecipullorum]
MSRAELLMTTRWPEEAKAMQLSLPQRLTAAAAPEKPVHIRGQHNLRKAFTPAKGE